jgi:hypothetical protein
MIKHLRAAAQEKFVKNFTYTAQINWTRPGVAP